MRTKFALLAVAGLGATQSILDVIPDCAKECLSEGIDNATDCEIDDGMCICEVDNYRNIYSVSYACVLLDCGEAVAITEILPAASSFCFEVTDGATAPPVDESPVETGAATADAATTTAEEGTATTGEANASSSSTGEGEPEGTDEPSEGGAALRSVFNLGSLVMGLLIAF